MTRIATTDESTVWKCESCGKLAETPTAFDRPNSWWTIMFERQLTHVTVRAVADYCAKDCVLDGLRYHHYVDAEFPKEAP